VAPTAGVRDAGDLPGAVLLGHLHCAVAAAGAGEHVALLVDSVDVLSLATGPAFLCSPADTPSVASPTQRRASLSNMDWDLVASLPDGDRAEILAAAAPRTFNRGEMLVHAGDRADSLHLIVEGRVAVEISTTDGDRATLNILGPGDYFGELSLVGSAAGGHRTATVLALEPTRTLSIDVVTFERLRTRQPAFERLLVTALAARVEQLSERLLDVLYVGLDRRLYRCLLDLAKIYGDDEVPLSIPLTQDQLAGLVGGTRPSVNQALQKLSGQGIVQLQRGRIVVRDLAALRRKASVPTGR
jgi:CRP-like cAMP-binding protein